MLPALVDHLGPAKMETLRARIKTDVVLHRDRHSYIKVFEITDTEPAEYVRAIQEHEILKTRVMGCIRGRRVSLPSFFELWNRSEPFRQRIENSADPQEAKWALSNQFGYKLATNFMPMYARSTFEFFDATSVLDPCAGWGDRMAGALASEKVGRYVGFDPNVNLIPGYIKIQADSGHVVTGRSDLSTAFDSNYTIHTGLFEEQHVLLGDETFDLAFTSPPFFDYEDYGDHVPKYENWIDQFYRPLFSITHDHLHAGCFFVVYLNDTVCGEIKDFMLNTVPTFTDFRYKGRLGMVGGCSKNIKDVHVFQKTEALCRIQFGGASP
jgi:hypothetical protein